MAPPRRAHRKDGKQIQVPRDESVNQIQVARDESVDVKKEASVENREASVGKKVKKMKQRRYKKPESYALYIHKVLKQVHPEISISKKGMAVMDSFMQDMFERLATESSSLTKISGRKVLSSREVQSAVRLAFPGELAKHAISEGAKALQSYTANR